MPLELNALRMALDEWHDADDEHRDEKAEAVRHIATPGLLVILLAAYDDSLEIIDRLRERYAERPL